ncbi:MAG: response regulator [Burkholderiales bacterium]|nr:response regulator [Burkholderiales bacterium]
MDEHARLIAILDDEVEFRLALARVLVAHRFECASFTTGEELIAAVAARHFDCVLLDLHMPGMSGFDVLTALQQSPAAPPAIVITGHDDPAYRDRGLALGALACHRKPIRTADLLTAIAQACEPRSAPP